MCTIRRAERCKEDNQLRLGMCACVCVSVNEDNEAVNRKVPLAGIRSTFHWHLPESSRRQNMCATPVSRDLKPSILQAAGQRQASVFFKLWHRCFVSWGTEVEIWFEFQSPFGFVHGKHRNASCREGEPRVWWLRHYENLVCVCACQYKLSALLLGKQRTEMRAL